MTESKIEAIKSLPKIDLHLHLDGAIRTRTILELGEKHGVTLPADNVEELSKHVQVQPSCRSLTDFLACFEVFYPVLQYPDAVERIAYELCEDLKKQGVVYAETRFAPVLLTEEGASQEELIQAALEGLKRGRSEFEVPVNLIVCAYRGTPPEASAEVVELAQKYREEGIVGIDFAGDESQYDAREHMEALELAREYNLPLTIHAGEAGAVENIREAVELGADRIGHGVRLEDDPELLTEIVDKEIPLEQCLTSNLQTQAVSEIAAHPFPDFYEQGVKVTINTDDPRISSTDINDEFLLAAESFDLDIADLKSVLQNSVEAAFVDESTRSRLRKII